MLKNKFGIGVSVEEISRFGGSDCQKGGDFVSSAFTQKEQDYCFSKKHTAQHLAARYAAKLAIYKAISWLEDAKGIGFLDVEIINDENGCPKAYFLKKEFSELKASVSLSHSAGKAIAFAIVAEGELPKTS